MKKRADIHQLIHSLRGSLKRKPGEKPITQELIEEHAEEVRRDEEANPPSLKLRGTGWARFEKWRQRNQQPAKRRRAKR